MDIILTKVLSEDNIRSFEAIYGPLTSNNIADSQEGLERRNLIQANAKTIRLSTIFATLDRRLIGENEQQAIKWLLPSRSLPSFIPFQNVSVEPNLNV